MQAEREKEKEREGERERLKKKAVAAEELTEHCMESGGTLRQCVMLD